MTIGTLDPANNGRSPLLPKRHSGNDAKEFTGASFSGAVFNLSTTIVGAGIMSLPAMMKVLGLVPGMLMIVLVALLVERSIEMLVRFSRAADAVSYSGLMGGTFGRCGRMMIQICVVVNNLGIMIAYMIIIGDVLSGTSSNVAHHSGILEGWFGEHWWNGRFCVLLVTTLVILGPLVSFKHVDSLRYTSALSVTLAVVFVAITAGITIVKLLNGSISAPRLLPIIPDLAAVWNLFTAVPILVTAYVCHYNVHSIDNEFKDPSQIKPIVRTSLALCSTIYIATSLFGFLLFGESTLDDVLVNFDSNLGIPYSSLLNYTVRISYSVHLMLVFPVIFYALRLNLDGLLFPSAGPLISDNQRFASITVGLLSVIFLAANFVPSIWDAFQFTGATAAICIGFIFPAAVALRRVLVDRFTAYQRHPFPVSLIDFTFFRDSHGISSKRDKVASVFMIVVAVMSNAVAVYSDAYSLFYKGTSHS